MEDRPRIPRAVPRRGAGNETILEVGGHPIDAAIVFEEPLVLGGYNARRRSATITEAQHEPPMNTLTIKGNWNIAKGKLKQKYAKLTDNDLRYESGKEDELLGRLEKITGEKREELERFLNDAGDGK
jgi:uncharacterized protein YjbJ (UPF0337 family)